MSGRQEEEGRTKSRPHSNGPSKTGFDISPEDLKRKSQLKNEYWFERTLFLPELGEVRLLKKKTGRQRIIHKSYVFSSKSEFEQQVKSIKQLMFLKHPGILEILDFETEVKSSLCSVNYRVEMYLEGFSQSLEQVMEQNQREKTLIAPKCLSTVLFGLVSPLSFLHDNGIAYKCLHPKLIAVNTQDGEILKVKIVPLANSLDEVHDLAKRAIATSSELYLSPELFEKSKILFKGNSSNSIELNLVDSFALGLIVLKCAIQEDNKGLYSSKSFNDALLQQKILTMKKYYGASSPQLVNLTEKLLATKPSKRLYIQDLAKEEPLQETRSISSSKMLTNRSSSRDLDRNPLPQEPELLKMSKLAISSKLTKLSKFPSPTPLVQQQLTTPNTAVSTFFKKAFTKDKNTPSPSSKDGVKRAGSASAAFASQSPSEQMRQIQKNLLISNRGGFTDRSQSPAQIKTPHHQPVQRARTEGSLGSAACSTSRQNSGDKAKPNPLQQSLFLGKPSSRNTSQENKEALYKPAKPYKPLLPFDLTRSNMVKLFEKRKSISTGNNQNQRTQNSTTPSINNFTKPGINSSVLEKPLDLTYVKLDTSINSSILQKQYSQFSQKAIQVYQQMQPSHNSAHSLSRDQIERNVYNLNNSIDLKGSNMVVNNSSGEKVLVEVIRHGPPIQQAAFGQHVITRSEGLGSVSDRLPSSTVYQKLEGGMQARLAQYISSKTQQSPEVTPFSSNIVPPANQPPPQTQTGYVSVAMKQSQLNSTLNNSISMLHNTSHISQLNNTQNSISRNYVNPQKNNSLFRCVVPQHLPMPNSTSTPTLPTQVSATTNQPYQLQPSASTINIMNGTKDYNSAAKQTLASITSHMPPAVTHKTVTSPNMVAHRPSYSYANAAKQMFKSPSTHVVTSNLNTSTDKDHMSRRVVNKENVQPDISPKLVASTTSINSKTQESPTAQSITLKPSGQITHSPQIVPISGSKRTYNVKEGTIGNSLTPKTSDIVKGIIQNFKEEIETIRSRSGSLTQRAPDTYRSVNDFETHSKVPFDSPRVLDSIPVSHASQNDQKLPLKYEEEESFCKECSAKKSKSKNRSQSQKSVQDQATQTPQQVPSQPTTEIITAQTLSFGPVPPSHSGNTALERLGKLVRKDNIMCKPRSPSPSVYKPILSKSKSRSKRERSSELDNSMSSYHLRSLVPTESGKEKSNFNNNSKDSKSKSKDISIREVSGMDGWVQKDSLELFAPTQEKLSFKKQDDNLQMELTQSLEYSPPPRRERRDNDKSLSNIIAESNQDLLTPLGRSDLISRQSTIGFANLQTINPAPVITEPSVISIEARSNKASPKDKAHKKHIKEFEPKEQPADLAEQKEQHEVGPTHLNAPTTPEPLQLEEPKPDVTVQPSPKAADSGQTPPKPPKRIPIPKSHKQTPSLGLDPILAEGGELTEAYSDRQSYQTDPMKGSWAQNQEEIINIVNKYTKFETEDLTVSRGGDGASDQKMIHLTVESRSEEKDFDRARMKATPWDREYADDSDLLGEQQLNKMNNSPGDELEYAHVEEEEYSDIHGNEHNEEEEEEDAINTPDNFEDNIALVDLKPPPQDMYNTGLSPVLESRPEDEAGMEEEEEESSNFRSGQAESQHLSQRESTFKMQPRDSSSSGKPLPYFGKRKFEFNQSGSKEESSEERKTVLKKIGKLVSPLERDLSFEADKLEIEDLADREEEEGAKVIFSHPNTSEVQTNPTMQAMTKGFILDIKGKSSGDTFGAKSYEDMEREEGYPLESSRRFSDVKRGSIVSEEQIERRVVESRPLTDIKGEEDMEDQPKEYSPLKMKLEFSSQKHTSKVDESSAPISPIGDVKISEKLMPVPIERATVHQSSVVIPKEKKSLTQSQMKKRKLGVEHLLENIIREEEEIVTKRGSSKLAPGEPEKKPEVSEALLGQTSAKKRKDIFTRLDQNNELEFLPEKYFSFDD